MGFHELKSHSHRYFIFYSWVQNSGSIWRWHHRAQQYGIYNYNNCKCEGRTQALLFPFPLLWSFLFLPELLQRNSLDSPFPLVPLTRILHNPHHTNKKEYVIIAKLQAIYNLTELDTWVASLPWYKLQFLWTMKGQTGCLSRSPAGTEQLLPSWQETKWLPASLTGLTCSS